MWFVLLRIYLVDTFHIFTLLQVIPPDIQKLTGINFSTLSFHKTFSILQLKSEQLKRQRVSKVGAFEGVNPTIDNPTPEYRAVQFAMREVLPIPANSLAYKSDYRQIRGGGSVDADELDKLTQLA